MEPGDNRKNSKTGKFRLEVTKFMSDQGSIFSSGVPAPQAVLCGNLGPFRDRNTLFSDGSRPQPTPAGSVQLGSPALMKLVWERVVALEFCSPLGCMWCRSSCFEGNLFHGNQTGCCWNSRLMSQCNILAHCDPQGCESQTRLCTFLSRVNVLMCKKILRGTIRLSHFAINRVLKCEVGRVTAVPG